ncbi:lipocalin family protein [Arcicella rosea]|uniref:lipocalin family protein n=1 Tax=Arcicella rosea TaxID=502909 RepID=UPI00286E5E71|nr:lipocalin family protein [Arcicella rosea]
MVASNSAVVGKWKVSTVKETATFLGTPGNYDDDLSSQNYFYEFKSDGTFKGNGQIDFWDSNEPLANEPISDKYVISGNELTLTYTDATTQKTALQIYSFTVVGTKLTWGLTLDQLKKAYANDANSLAALSPFTALNFNIE